MHRRHHSAITGRAAHRRARRGVSLVEALIALAICALLLTATMVATDASFKAYATATEQASTQSSLRLVMHRLLKMVRTSIAHGPLAEADGTGFTINGNTITSSWLAMQSPTGQIVRLTYVPDQQVITYSENGGTAVPILGGVTNASFICLRRRSYDSTDHEWVLDRAIMDLEVQADDDATLAIEDHKLPPIHVVASTMPRRLE